jgi:cation diffusion facilitator family transporter
VSANSSTSHIVQSLVTNLVIAAIKTAAAVFTGSGAMLAEAIHSSADCGNQVLLLLGVRQSRKGPDAVHPLGYGRALYFWSFMVALLLFTGGGVFSIYEGIHKISHPEPLDHVWLGVGILAVSLLLEGGATLGNLREMGRRRGATPLLRYLRETKDSDLIVVFGENAAATLGLVLAMSAMAVAELTGDARFDGLGSLLVGLVLVAVAVFLAVEVKSLLVGESADPRISAAVREVVAASATITAVHNVITIQQGPGEVMVALKVGVAGHLAGTALYEAINRFEDEVQARCPEVKWLFVEPDSEA